MSDREFQSIDFLSQKLRMPYPELMISALQSARLKYTPPLPKILCDLLSVEWKKEDAQSGVDLRIQALFPHLQGQPYLSGSVGVARKMKPLRIGVLFSGGPAAGGHNVIAGLFDALLELHGDSQLFGFQDGPSGVLTGKAIPITAVSLEGFRNVGGFNLLGTGRTKIETPEQLASALSVAQKMDLTGIVIIGGDDSNTNAAILAEYFLKNGCKTQVIGVPKTIDGDLKNPWVEVSFGFDTASKTYAASIANIAADARSAKKYYHFIKVMGRSASHIALECALTTQPNWTLIGEEIAAEKQTLSAITNGICELIEKRARQNKYYGVILIPEGIIEFIPEVATLIRELNALLSKGTGAHLEEVAERLTAPSRGCFQSLPKAIQSQLLFARDAHGNVALSFIETERLLAEMVSEQLAGKVPFASVTHFLGYEGRSGFPSNFDCNYCYALGKTAALLLDAGVTGYMACVRNLAGPVEAWQIGGVPLAHLLTIDERKGKEKPVIRKALVDLQGESFIHFKKQRAGWMLEDAYLFPGPIQFFGEKALTDAVPLSLRLEESRG